MQRNKKLYRLARILLLTFVISMVSIQCTKETTKQVMAAEKLAAPKLTVVSRTTSSVNLSIKKSAGATGYQIYRSEQKNGTYKKIKTIKTLTYKDKDIINNSAYFYKVRAYKKVNDKNVFSSYSDVKKADKVLGKVANVKATTKGKNIILTWSKVNSATEYRIYRSESKSGTYSYYGSSKTLSFTDSKVQAGSSYYYKIRAYSLKDKTKYYGSYSNIISKKVPANESNDKPTENVDFEQEVLRLVNVERAKQGLSNLSTTTSLRNAAYKRATEIQQVFSHDRPNGTSCFTVLDEFGISYRACGENIAWGQRTPAEVVNAWMNSEGHRKNILSPSFGKLGVGCYVKNNTLYWTQLFTN